MTNVGKIAFRIGKRGTCNCLHSRGNMRHLMHVSPFGTGKGQRASFTSYSMVPSVRRSVSVRVGSSSVHISACHSDNTNKRRVGGASSTVQVARLPAKVIIRYRGRHSRRVGGSGTVRVLGSGLCMLGRRRRTRGVSSVHKRIESVGFKGRVHSCIVRPCALIGSREAGTRVDGMNTMVSKGVSPFVGTCLDVSTRTRGKGGTR